MVVIESSINITPMLVWSEQSQIACEMIEAAPNADINMLYAVDKEQDTQAK
jgi:hypothetical protein